MRLFGKRPAEAARPALARAFGMATAMGDWPQGYEAQVRADRDRKFDVVERLHVILSQVEMKEAVPRHLWQRPDEGFGMAARLRDLCRRLDQRPS